MNDSILKLSEVGADDIKYMLDAHLSPGELELATEFAWDDIWAVVEDADIKRHPLTGDETRTPKGRRMLLAQVKGTFYSKRQITDNQRFLQDEPHKTLNEAYRKRVPREQWRVSQMIPEKVVSGTMPSVANPNG